MSIFTLKAQDYFNNKPYIEGLKLNVADNQQQILETAKEQVAVHQAALANVALTETSSETKTSSETSSNTILYVVLGVAVVGMLTFIVLKKKGALK
jgi:hypothetical protein